MKPAVAAVLHRLAREAREARRDAQRAVEDYERPRGLSGLFRRVFGEFNGGAW